MTSQTPEGNARKYSDVVRDGDDRGGIQGDREGFRVVARADDDRIDLRHLRAFHLDAEGDGKIPPAFRNHRLSAGAARLGIQGTLRMLHLASVHPEVRRADLGLHGAFGEFHAFCQG
ncbi:hypothetical protein [Sorangium sp. So ce341]|uniref:hypothetical protein n=1 Tax=Sorangium sp. So ce341 TaxID=3133302 RepID=UPI003F60C585